MRDSDRDMWSGLAGVGLFMTLAIIVLMVVLWVAATFLPFTK